MILAHAIIGLMPVDQGQISVPWLIGSILPDIDHVVLILRRKKFSPRWLIDSLANEEKYGITYKTKYVHSILGAIIASSVVFLIDPRSTMFFFLGYFGHLVLDFPDKDEKQYFYPLRLKIHGWLPIGSKPEIIFTLLLIIIYFIIA